MVDDGGRGDTGGRLAGSAGGVVRDRRVGVVHRRSAGDAKRRHGPAVHGPAEGQGGGIVRVSVPQDIPLAVGNLVVLPGASARVYGAITHIEAPESSPQQFGYVAGPIPLASIRMVHISTARAPTLTYEEARAVVASASTTLFGVPIPDDVLIGTSTPTSTSHQ